MSSCRHGDLERRRTFLVNFPERAQHVICSLELIEICLVYVSFVRLYIIFICISRSILDGYFNPLVLWFQWEYLLTSKVFFCRVPKIGNDINYISTISLIVLCHRRVFDLIWTSQHCMLWNVYRSVNIHVPIRIYWYTIYAHIVARSDLQWKSVLFQFGLVDSFGLSFLRNRPAEFSGTIYFCFLGESMVFILGMGHPAIYPSYLLWTPGLQGIAMFQWTSPYWGMSALRCKFSLRLRKKTQKFGICWICPQIG